MLTPHTNWSRFFTAARVELEAGAAADLRSEDRALHPGVEDRATLKEAGIRCGRIAAYIPDAQKPASQRMIALLKTVSDGRQRRIAPEGAGSFELDGNWLDEDLTDQGYLRFGKRAVRADLAERLGWELSKRRREAGKAQFEVPPELASIVSCPLDAFHIILKGFGLAPAEKDSETGAVKLWRFQSKARLEEAQQRRQRSQASAARAGRTSAKPGAQKTSADSDNKSSGGPKGKRKPGDRTQRNDRPRHEAHRKSSRPAPRQPDPDSPFAALAILLPSEPDKKPKKKRKPKKRVAPQENRPAATADPVASQPEAAALLPDGDKPDAEITETQDNSVDRGHD